MEYPQTPSQHFRVETLAPALIWLLVIAAVQPLVAITTTVMPFDVADAAWRLRVFELLLATTSQIAVSLVLIAAVGLFSERYQAVRGASIAAWIQAVLLIPILILYSLDVFQVQRMVPLDQLKRFHINALQTAGTAAVMVPILFWMGFRGMRAGKKPAVIDVEDALLIDKEPLPGTLDPRVIN